jgi:acyl carrier protein
MIFETLQEAISEQMNKSLSEITMDTTFKDDLGADSLDIIQIIIGLEKKFDILFENDDAANLTTVRDAVEYIKKVIDEKR